jgi:hypothetical protein
VIQRFVDKFMSDRSLLAAKWSENHPESYEDIFKEVINILSSCSCDSVPDPKRITVIDHGSWQGTLLFVVASKDYQPDVFWFCKVDYGSCSGCDTFESIRDYSGSKPTEKQVKGYLTLALHMVQEIKEIGGGE